MIALDPAHAAVLAAIHAATFPPGERWGEAAMAGLLASPGVFGFVDERGGCVLARAVAGEAEILTVAVSPVLQRRGVGRALLDAVLAVTDGLPVFLEVAADNMAARGLYASAGFVPCGHRRNYYGAGRDAVILRQQSRPTGARMQPGS